MPEWEPPITAVLFGSAPWVPWRERRRKRSERCEVCGGDRGPIRPRSELYCAGCCRTGHEDYLKRKKAETLAKEARKRRAPAKFKPKGA